MNSSYRCPHRSDDRRGSVLIPVLMIMLLLAYLGLQVGREIAVDYAGAAYLRSSLEAGSALDFGMQTAEAILLRDQEEAGATDHLRERWANPGEDFRLATEALNQNELSATITDEQGLLPINRLRKVGSTGAKAAKGYQTIFVRLVNQLRDRYEVDADPELLLQSVLLWLGEGVKGLDDDAWYAGQDPPYTRRGGDFTNPEELLLVRWRDVPDEDREAILRGRDGGPGLLDYISVWSNAPINMNTAPEAVVRAVAGSGSAADNFWDEVRMQRAEPDGATGGSWYLPLAQAAGLNMSNFPSNSLGVTSDVFRVVVKYDTGPGSIRRMNVLRRGNRKTITLYSLQY